MKILTLLIILSALFTACDHKEKITENDVVSLIDLWKEAYYQKDTSLLNEVLHKDYIYAGNANDTFSSKSQSKLNLINSDFDIIEINLNNPEIICYTDFAIVRGSEKITLRLSNGDTTNVKLQFTDIYIMDNGRAQALATHSSPLE
ncbi:MAG: nuclear transport factor 2 family protein [Imperialibacter sp.]|uniref:nuclear transport factor 2 family protein n=1 Tax=Imperialibacter sp. TaxID=2038411 RepID=UPI003A881A9E